MINRAASSKSGWLVAVLATLATACGGSNDTQQPTSTPTATRTLTPIPTAIRTPTPTATSGVIPHPTPSPSRTATPLVTATPTQSSAAVSGLVVVNHSVMSGPDDVLGAPPPEWSGDPSKAPFDRSLSYADWSVAGADKQGVTGADGRFAIAGLPPGHYSFQVTKTLDGNLATLSFPFAVGDAGTTTVVAEVSWGLVRSVSTYTQLGAQVQEIRGPYGSVLITQDGRVRELGDPSHSLVDADGDGQFDTPACVAHVWDCAADPACGNDRSCACTASCPFCDDCGPGVCVPPASISPYRCAADDSCAQPGDRCVCVSSCPDCKDCTRRVCVPNCLPVEITAITIVSGPSQLVVGQQGAVSAIAQLSDGSQIDVTQLATWHSSSDAVATVDSWGQAIGRGIGAAALTATIGTLTSVPWSVEVVQRPTLLRIDVQNVSCYYPRGVPIDFGSAPPVAAPPSSGILPPMPTCGQVVQIGKTIQFRAAGEFANGYYQDITDEVQWQVAPGAVGDVAAGLFTARQAGTAQLTAALNGVVSDGTQIRVVTQPSLVALSIYSDNGIIVFIDGGPSRVDVAIPCRGGPGGGCCCPGPLADGAVNPCDCGYSITVLRGDQVKFRATAQYDTGEFRDVTAEVTWRSSNAAAASIDAGGVMTAVEAGDATIDAVLGEVSSNDVGVHVVNQATLQSLYIYQEGTDRVVAKGDQRFFKATGNYDIGFGRDVTNTATWRSSNDSVGGFDTPGVFTARTAGTVQVWAELDGQESNRLPLEVYETSDITYCDAANVNRAAWSDNFNRVTLESDCAEYHQPGVVGLRYTVTELQPRGGVFDPCLDLYVYQGDKRVRTIREEGCGDPFLPTAAPGRDEAVLKYQLRAFWDLKGDNGQPVTPGTYTIYGRFYLYYDPVVSIDVDVLTPDGTFPSPVPTRTPTPRALCTPVFCPTGGVLVCPDHCPGGCGYVCVPQGQLASLDVGSATGAHGDAVQFDVSLHTAGQPVAGTQNDLLFDPSVAVAAKANGRPDCSVNPDIDKNATGFTFIPVDCQPGLDCKGMRAIVIATDNSDPIPDAAVLYTCTVAISSNVAPGSYPLFASSVAGSNPTGDRILMTSSGGAITVVLRPGETLPTVSATPTPPSYPVCTPPVCGPGQVRSCPDKCLGGCGFICATPTPTPFVVCTPPPCKDGEVLLCPGECPEGCGVVCGRPQPTPTPEGWCFHQADCQGGAEAISQSLCCTLARESASPLPFTWCPLDQFDGSTGVCLVCAGDPCSGAPRDAANQPPFQLSSLDERCDDQTAAGIVSGVRSRYDVTLKAHSDFNLPAEIPLTMLVSYRAGTLTCYPAVIPPPGSTRPVVLAQVGAVVHVEFVTVGGAFSEAFDTEIKGRAGSVSFSYTTPPDTLRGSYRPDLPGYENVGVGFFGNFAGDQTNGGVSQFGQRPEHASELTFVAQWSTWY